MGDAVLIKDDAFKRNERKKGKVEQLIFGNDGHVRGALLKVSHRGNVSHIQRPIQKIIPLEVQKEQNVQVPVSDCNRNDISTDNIPIVNHNGNISLKGRKRNLPNRLQVRW